MATAVSKFGDVDLKCTYQFHDDPRYQDALGKCWPENRICGVLPCDVFVCCSFFLMVLSVL